jgi:hypothetical protein
MLIAGCGDDDGKETKKDNPDVTVKAAQLCAKCGEIKGTENCCNPDAEKCAHCKLNAGSPACCKHIDFSKGDVELCTHCGQVKGSEKCCAADAEKCPSCGLAKGSPGCCKLGKAI